MPTFDRIVLVVLAVGVWALVLAPREIGAHHKDDIVSHACDIYGSAYGEVEGNRAAGQVRSRTSGGNHQEQEH